MKRLTQSEMHLACSYLNDRWGKSPYRVKRRARRAVLRGLKRAPPFERAKRYTIMAAYFRAKTTV